MRLGTFIQSEATLKYLKHSDEMPLVMWLASFNQSEATLKYLKHSDLML